MSGFLKINKLIFPYECIVAAYEHMRKMGNHNVEGVAIFAGREYGDVFSITNTIIPEQTAYSIDFGLLYSVAAEELHRLNVFLYDRQLSLIAQIHSHPGKAYHSDTDNASPIITTVGGVSIVVPDFASGSIDLINWAVYRLSKKNYWEQLKYKEVKQLIEIIK